MSEPSRVGRWRTGQQNKQRILEVARGRFMRDGYDRTTVRAVAGDAGVDVAMIYYFFDSKEGLFLASSVTNAQHPLRELDALLDEGTADIGARLVRSFLERGDEHGIFNPLLTLWQSPTTQPLVKQMMDGTLAGQLADRVASEFGVADAKLRVELVSTHLAGVAFVRYQLQLEPLASASIDDLVLWVGPAIQRYLTDANADLNG